MVCPTCGQTIEEGSTRCTVCGTIVDNAQSQDKIQPESQSSPGQEMQEKQPKKQSQPQQSEYYEDEMPRHKSKAWLVFLLAGIAVFLFMIMFFLVAFVIFYPQYKKYLNKAQQASQMMSTQTSTYSSTAATTTDNYLYPTEDPYVVTTTAEEWNDSTTETATAAEVSTVTEHRYEIIVGDITWMDAEAACRARGGYLATITSQEEYDQICALANNYNVRYLWLGARIYSEDETWGQNGWLTGEAWNYECWYPGEPSKKDLDGTEEFYLCMWKAKIGNESEATTWTYNDQRNDIVGAVPSISGKLGYVMEYEVEVQQ